MKAAVCRAFREPLVIEEVSLREARGSEVEVEVAACAICHSDITYMDGGWGGTLPAIYGHEAAGTVRAVGPQASAVRPGDHVAITLLRSCGRCHYCVGGSPHLCEATFPLDQASPLAGADGKPIAHGLKTAAFAEAVLVEESQVAKLPGDMAFDVASLLSCGVLTGFGAVVNTAKVPFGASVAVIGTGGVGLNCVQGAKISGAQPIIAIDLADEKLDAALRFGATHAVNSSQQPPAEAVRALTGGRGADFVFVSVGSAGAFKQGLTLLANGGSLVVVGMPATGAMSEYEPTDLAYRSQRILGSRMGSARLAIDLPRLVDAYRQDNLKLDELITARYPLHRINEAIDSARAGKALRNVIVF
jgi:S-(hydroxymethyl)glutathione dehydrogenase / alcohol dehydrogenase